MTLAERYCKKCINYEMCQATGCADRKELEELLSKTEPRLSEEEYKVLQELFDDGYNYITRDRDESLYAYEEYPYKNEYGGYWNDTDSRGKPIDCTNFKFIKWEDEEPTSIEVLLAEYENAMKLNEKG